MGPLLTLLNVDKTFPTVVTNQFVNSMARRELTETEKAKSYAKYYYKDMALIPENDLKGFNNGPIDPTDALPITLRNKVMEPGYHNVETGFCLMPDGSGYAATKVFMPYVTPTMLDWWFNWHPLEGLRYAIWCPVAHASISAETPNAHKDASGIDLSIRNYGKSHFPEEGFNLQGAQKLRIHFRTAEDMGLDMSSFHEPNIARLYTATVTHEIGPISFPINIFMHCIRQTEGGVEYRSRYWLGWTIDNHGRIIRSKWPTPRNTMYHLARCNCLHSLMEYNNLASILPALYSEHQGRID